MMNEPAQIHISIDQREALVLEDFLCMLEEQAFFQQIDLADRLVVYKVHGVLQRSLDDLSSPNYDQLLKAYRKAIEEAG